MASSSGPLHFIHNAPPEDHDLKRQYLGLMPPQQVIDICLALDIHVPVALKRNIWPTDFRAAIAAMQNLVPKLEDTPATIPPASSGPTTAPGTPRAEHQPPKPSSEPKPPDKKPTAGPSTTPSLPHPTQPYGFSTQPAYPHTPYYQALPPGYAPFSYPAYAAPPPGFPAGYSTSFPPGYPSHATPFFTTTTLGQDSTHATPAQVAEDTDLPSYEDMIVEGLNAVGDPEGLAPKDLFNWMAARYPVQSNFRPSASQALQKAFRRGRFEKSTNGRYRLNANWEGGNSSTRRATRRPQTQSSMPVIPKPRQQSSPFTPAASPFTTTPRPMQQPYGRAPFSTAPSVKPVAAKAPSVVAPKQTPPADVPAPKPTVPPTNDAYQAAQKILQKINFGAVFKLEDDEGRGLSIVKTEAVTMSLADHARAELQAQLALLAAQLEEIAKQEEQEDADDDVDAQGEDEENDDDMEEVQT
ncbi:hypothetical protein C8R43DRAFT_1011869 [Mycena crocata]|nr:hypothetical protein C8R43DRAFT_1011869 [Mycena crocata]